MCRTRFSFINLPIQPTTFAHTNLEPPMTPTQISMNEFAALYGDLKITERTMYAGLDIIQGTHPAHGDVLIVLGTGDGALMVTVG